MSTHLVQVVREGMRAKRLSVRALARAAGISHSAVSRLLNGQSRTSVGTLSALAPVLDLTLDELLIPDGTASALRSGGGGVLRHLGLEAVSPALVAEVHSELDRLRRFAATREARTLARDLFPRKVEDIGAAGPIMERLWGLRQLYLSDDTPPAVREAAGSAVLYFVQAVDAIDDFLWPIGYLDDAVAVELAEQDIRALREGEGRPPR